MASKASVFSQRGFSLLEQTMVLPVLLLFIAGAFDINTLLQAHTALQEGVTASLRCVYTTDGKCVSVTPDSRPRLYNYYRIERHAEYLVDLFDFSGTMRWIDRPNYLYNNFQATVLDTVQYDQPTANIVAQRKYYPAERSATYALRTSDLPYIEGTARNPILRHRGTPRSVPAQPQGSYPATTSAVSGVDLISDDALGQPATVHGYAYFSTPPAPQKILLSNYLNRPGSQGHAADYSSGLQSGTFVHVALHITGDKSATTVGSTGGVAIDLQREDVPGFPPGWRTVEPLGAQQLGRAPGEGSSANFVIRGLPDEYIDGSVPDYQELHKYPLPLQWNTRYRIKFTLTRSAGRVGWQAHELRLYYPLDVPRQEVFPCQGGLPPCSAAESCQISAGPPPEILDPAVIIHSEQAILRYDPPILLQNCSPGRDPIEVMLVQHSIHECPAAFEFQADPASCPITVETQNCPAIGTASSGMPNYGVPESPGTDGFIRSSASASSICSPPSGALAGEPQNPRWTVHNASVPFDDIEPGSDGSLEHSRQQCDSSAAWPAHSRLGNYFHLFYGQALLNHIPHYTGSIDPVALKADPSSGFACSEFPLRESTVDITPQSRTPDNGGSLFFGEHLKPGCNWEEVLRQDALNYQLIPAQAYFVANSPSLSSRKEQMADEPDACVDPVPEIVWSDPDSQALVLGGPFPEGTIPVECQGTGIACSAEFAGFGQGQQSGTNYNFDYAAQHFGFNEIQARYPAARWNCPEKHCATLTVQEDGPFLNATASMAVPLYVLGRKTVELRYAGRERKEAEFSN